MFFQVFFRKSKLIFYPCSRLSFLEKSTFFFVLMSHIIDVQRQSSKNFIAQATASPGLNFKWQAFLTPNAFLSEVLPLLIAEQEEKEEDFPNAILHSPSWKFSSCYFKCNMKRKWRTKPQKRVKIFIKRPRRVLFLHF